MKLKATLTRKIKPNDFIKKLKKSSTPNEKFLVGQELLGLFLTFSRWVERIKFEKDLFIIKSRSSSYMRGCAFCKSTYSAKKDWFDIKEPKMRDMTPKEMALFCRDNNYIGVSKTDVTTHYHIVDTTIAVDVSHSYLDENGNEQKFPQVEEQND